MLLLLLSVVLVVLLSDTVLIAGGLNIAVNFGVCFSGSNLVVRYPKVWFSFSSCTVTSKRCGSAVTCVTFPFDRDCRVMVETVLLSSAPPSC